MRIRLFLLFAFAAAGVLTNVATAGNIAHGVKVVVIDPGHGGIYPGAIRGGVNEKDIVLKVALKFGKLIEEEMPGVKVIYTRKTDKALCPDKTPSRDALNRDLQARADIANKAGADLFISIHANAVDKSTAVRGVETLIIGENTKAKEKNEDALFENNRDDLIDMSDEKTAAIVRAYLQNLQFTYGEYSMALARCVQNNYLKTGRHSRGVKSQLLKVLYAVDMPGVLTEIGFMSNPQELAYMKSTKGQDEIARSLLEALKDYSAYVIETRLDEDEAAAQQPAEKPGQVVGKEPVRAADAENKPAAKDTATQAEKPAAAKQPAKADMPKDTAPADKDARKPAVQPRRYGVQVLASAQPVPTASAQFKNFSGKVKQYTAEGRYRYKYCVGEFETRAEAQKYQDVVRMIFPEAFVVCFQGTQIVK
ncbi:N-acetylmuramoyl-L-alanine amidase [uncultured Alistipes sp.]|jgi:N-acetylmuramoyl-L-alanine amidase|uniref:N-acetylmuramoyl-L-alanine amidase family protein n=1 Tax=uncultured Alistipes sp. TaxID=538949 RepID=UPI0025E7EC62|nr:N-acetylmuramoyl-L-alanine amidase [uncultured Alistipes sp.]